MQHPGIVAGLFISLRLQRRGRIAVGFVGLDYLQGIHGVAGSLGSADFVDEEGIVQCVCRANAGQVHIRIEPDAALGRTDAPDGLILEFQSMPEVFVQGFSFEAIGFIHLPDDALYEAILPALVVFELVEGDEQVAGTQGHDGIIAPGGIVQRVSGKPVHVPGLQRICFLYTSDAADE